VVSLERRLSHRVDKFAASLLRSSGQTAPDQHSARNSGNFGSSFILHDVAELALQGGISWYEFVLLRPVEPLLQCIGQPS
jgi:hypothetical protein